MMRGWLHVLLSTTLSMTVLPSLAGVKAVVKLMGHIAPSRKLPITTAPQVPCSSDVPLPAGGVAAEAEDVIGG